MSTWPCRYAAEAPNRLWVADLTQHPTDEGWLCLASILDVFSRRVVGWAVGERATADLVVDALNMAIWRRKPQAQLIHHSDHGARYTWLAFTRRLEEAGIMAWAPWGRSATPWTTRWPRASTPAFSSSASRGDGQVSLLTPSRPARLGGAVY